MVKYTLKRLIQGLITVLVIGTIVFLLLRLMPPDYYFTEDELMKLTEAEKNERLEAAGYMDPIIVQLGRFYKGIVTFDFGTSRRIQSGIAVTKVIGSKFTVSMKLGLIALCISVVIGVLLGILQTIQKGKVGDWIVTAYTIIVNAVPSLVLYSLVLVFGSLVLGLPSVYSSRTNTALSCVLPVTCLCLGSIAGYALWTRRYMVDELNKDYIRLAKIKGLTNGEIMVKHVLRNAFVPLAQYLPASFLLTISGSLLVETFFSVPGMGPLLTNAIKLYDLNVVQCLVLLYASLSILGVFLGDVLMMLIDPRIKLAGKGETR